MKRLIWILFLIPIVGLSQPTSLFWAANSSNFRIVYEYAYSVVLQDSLPYYVDFKKDDGSKMYVLGDKNKSIFQYSLTTAWTFAGGVSYDSKALNLTAIDNKPYAFRLNSDCDTMFFVGGQADYLYCMSNSTPSNISLMSLQSNYSLAARGGNAFGLDVKPDGTKFFILDVDTDSIYQFRLATGWNLSSVTYERAIYIGNLDGYATGLAFYNNGSQLHIIGTDNDTEYVINCPNAYDLNGATYTGKTFYVGAYDNSPTGMAFKTTDWNKMFISAYQHSSIYQFNIIR